MRYIDKFRDPKAAAQIRDSISLLCRQLEEGGRTLRIMEVCGSHTMAISRYGIRSVLGPTVRLISGPGCPVCVTTPGYIDAAIELARTGALILSFGDLLNVPGSMLTLAQARSQGLGVETCYSPLTALEIAARDRKRQVVFLGIGFETTVGPVIAMVDRAHREGIRNLSVLTAFKRVPPVLHALVTDPELKIDAFLLPAHVSAIIGEKPYQVLAERYGKSCVIAGFEPLDILYGINGILQQALSNQVRVDNQYNRVVKPAGNQRASRLIEMYLQPSVADWRGIGQIPFSGYELREQWSAFDAPRRFDMVVPEGHVNPGCRCGDVLRGVSTPPDCPLFGKACMPSQPVGPCMVSSEGTCAAYYRYERPGVKPE